MSVCLAKANGHPCAPFFSHFPATKGAKLAKQVRLVRYPHKALIFKENTVSNCIYLVLTGRSS